MFAHLFTRRNGLRGALFALAGTMLVACQPGTVGGGPSINTSKPIPVALLLPYGSGEATDETLAQNLENAARLAINDLGGVQIDLRVYQTAGDAQRAATVTQEALSDGAKVILGPLYSQAANAAGLQAANRGVNVLTFSNNPDIAGGNVFLLGQTFQSAANRLVRYAAQNGKTSMLVAHANNPAGDVGKRAIQQAAAGSATNVVATVGYELSQQGIVDAMSPIADEAKAKAVDSIFLTADVNSDLPFVAQLLPEQGLPAEDIQYMGLTRWDAAPQLFNLDAVKGGWFAIPDQVRYSQFTSRFAAAYGGAPHPLAGLAYDGIAAIGALAKTQGSDALTAAALTNPSGFSGVYGSFRFRGDGSNERAMAIATVEEGQVRVLDPAPIGFGGGGL